MLYASQQTSGPFRSRIILVSYLHSVLSASSSNLFRCRSPFITTNICKKGNPICPRTQSAWMVWKDQIDCNSKENNFTIGDNGELILTDSKSWLIPPSINVGQRIPVSTWRDQNRARLLKGAVPLARVRLVCSKGIQVQRALPWMEIAFRSKTDTLHIIRTTPQAKSNCIQLVIVNHITLINISARSNVN